MIIRIVAADRSIEVEDAHNFRAFMVRIQGKFENQATQDEVLGCAAISHDLEHAWIPERWLREWPSLAGESWWQDGLTSMIAAVQRFGWVDPANDSIRAHIEYTS
jgi:hypothetical protein